MVEMTTVERVARAINPSVWDDDHPSWAELSPVLRRDFLHHEQKRSLDRARRAIHALRESSVEMWQGWRSVNCEYDHVTQHAHFHGDIGNWRACHAAMIDAALSESPA